MVESRRGNREVGDDFDDLVEVVERDDGIEEHKEGFRYVEDIFHGSSRFGLEVADAVVAHIANGTAGKRREYESWNCRYSEL